MSAAGSEATSARRPVPGIDPRIRARRIAVRRDEGRRRRNRLVWAGAVLAVVAASGGLVLSPLLDVDAVVVRGAARTGPGLVAATAGVADGDALALLDAAGAEAAVGDLPWVEGVDVVRRWPGTVEVHVRERVPVAGFGADDGSLLAVDGEGQVLGTLPADEAAVVVVEGVAAGAPPGRAVTGAARPALALASVVPGDIAARGATIVVGPGGELSLRLDGTTGPIEVLFGGDEALGAKVTALSTVLGAADLDGVDTIDVRVPSAPTLTRS